MCQLTLAQSLDRQVVGSTGGDGGNGNLSVSYTVGETFVTTLTSGSIVLTQGFQQPTATVVGIARPDWQWEVTHFPNPATEALMVALQGDWTGDIQLEVVSILGQLLHSEQVYKSDQQHQYTVPVRMLPDGQYVLVLRFPDQSPLSLPFQKIH